MYTLSSCFQPSQTHREGIGSAVFRRRALFGEAQIQFGAGGRVCRCLIPHSEDEVVDYAGFVWNSSLANEKTDTEFCNTRPGEVFTTG